MTKDQLLGLIPAPFRPAAGPLAQHLADQDVQIEALARRVTAIERAAGAAAVDETAGVGNTRDEINAMWAREDRDDPADSAGR